MGLSEVARIGALDSPSRYQPAMNVSANGLSSRGQIQTKFKSTDAVEAAKNAAIAAPVIPPNILITGESSSREIPTFMEQRFNLKYSSDWNMPEK